MSGATVKDIIREISTIKQASKAYTVFGDDSYKEIIDLGTDLYRNCIIKNGINKALTLKFTSPTGVENTMSLASSETLQLANFYHSGKVYGLRSESLGSGSIVITCW